MLGSLLGAENTMVSKSSHSSYSLRTCSLAEGAQEEREWAVCPGPGWTHVRVSRRVHLRGEGVCVFVPVRGESARAGKPGGTRVWACGHGLGTWGGGM